MGYYSECFCYIFLITIGGAALVATTMFEAGITLAVATCFVVTATAFTAGLCILRVKSGKEDSRDEFLQCDLTSIKLIK